MTSFQTLFPKIVEISKSLGPRRWGFMEDARRVSIYSQVIERNAQIVQDSTEVLSHLSTILEKWSDHRDTLEQFSLVWRQRFVQNQRRGRFTDKTGDRSILLMLGTITE